MRNLIFVSYFLGILWTIFQAHHSEAAGFFPNLEDPLYGQEHLVRTCGAPHFIDVTRQMVLEAGEDEDRLTQKLGECAYRGNIWVFMPLLPIFYSDPTLAEASKLSIIDGLEVLGDDLYADAQVSPVPYLHRIYLRHKKIITNVYIGVVDVIKKGMDLRHIAQGIFLYMNLKDPENDYKDFLHDWLSYTSKPEYQSEDGYGKIGQMIGDIYEGKLYALPRKLRKYF